MEEAATRVLEGEAALEVVIVSPKGPRARIEGTGNVAARCEDGSGRRAGAQQICWTSLGTKPPAGRATIPSPWQVDEAPQPRMVEAMCKTERPAQG
jgi:hypothetical protein